MKNDTYIINDLDAFINSTRAIVYNSFDKETMNNRSDEELDHISENDLEEFNNVLSYAESKLIANEFIKTQTNKKTQIKRSTISEHNYVNYINALSHRMIGNLLKNLAEKNLIEIGYDNEVNDFIFWIKDAHKNNQKPETN